MPHLRLINSAAAIAAAVLVLATAAASFAGREACVGDCDTSGAVEMTDLVTLIDAALGVTQTTTCDVDGDASVEHVVQAVDHAHGGCPVLGTPTPTPTLTPTYDPNAPLGRRRFEVNPTTSGFSVAVAGGTRIRLGTFTGQSGGVAEDAFFELEAGVPDSETQIATINVTSSSEYLVAPVNTLGVNFTVCLKLITPVLNAGAIDCDGGSDYSIGLRADHNAGELGIDGFTADQCTAIDGVIEEGTRLCKTGKELELCRADSDCDTSAQAGDGECGLAPSQCVEPPTFATCRNDSECDSAAGAEDGQCGQTRPHIGVCNGPFTPILGSTDTGPGSITFAPIGGLLGLPATLNLEEALPCGDEGPGQPLSFALTSTRAQAIIEDAGNKPHETLDFALTQATTATPRQYELQNFSCQQWSDAAGPGCLGLVAPVLHQLAGADVVTAFKLCGR